MQLFPLYSCWSCWISPVTESRRRKQRRWKQAGTGPSERHPSFRYESVFEQGFHRPMIGGGCHGKSIVWAVSHATQSKPENRIDDDSSNTGSDHEKDRADLEFEQHNEAYRTDGQSNPVNPSSRNWLLKLHYFYLYYPYYQSLLRTTDSFNTYHQALSICSFRSS